LQKSKQNKKNCEFGPLVSEVWVFKVLLTNKWHRVFQNTKYCFFWSTYGRDVIKGSIPLF